MPRPTVGDRIAGVTARALVSRRLPGLQRWIVGTLVAVTIVLGVIGWHRLDVADPDLRIDTLGMIHDVSFLFVFVSPGGAVNLPLAIARLTGPAATTGVVLSTALLLGEARLHAWAARRSRGHDVLVGPPDRVRAHLPAGPGHPPFVHLDAADRPVLADGLHVRLDLDAGEWADGAALDRAARLVVATGDDELNLALLASAERTPAGGCTTVELSDRSASIALAISLARSAPDRDLDVVCTDDVVSRLAAQRCLAARVDDRAVVVVGDGPVNALALVHLVAALIAEHQLDSRSRPRLVVACSGLDPREVLATHDDPTNLDLRVVDDLDALLGAVEGPCVGIVATSERARSVRLSVELLAARPGSQLVVECGASALPLPGVTPLSIEDLATTHGVEGVWSRLARHRHDAARRRGADLPPWDLLDESARRTARADARHLVALLESAGRRLSPDARATGVDLLDRRTVDLLDAADTAGRGDADTIVDRLRDVGIVLTAVATTPGSTGGGS